MEAQKEKHVSEVKEMLESRVRETERVKKSKVNPPVEDSWYTLVPMRDSRNKPFNKIVFNQRTPTGVNTIYVGSDKKEEGKAFLAMIQKKKQLR